MLGFKSTKSHANPAIKVFKQKRNLSYPNVVGPSSNYWIQVFEDGLDVSPLVAFCQRSDTVFEPIDGLISDSKAVVPKVKPEKLETLIEVGDLCFGLAQREFEFPEYLRHICQGVLSFFTAAAENHKVVSVSHMAQLLGLEGLIQVVENQVAQPW
jgi:hypothetical protein